MPELTLYEGRILLYDEEDAELVNNHKWSASKKKNTHYVIGSSGALKNKRLHRLILNAGFGQEVDHINGNGLDNRRRNLRLATRSQNAANAINSKKLKSSFPYRGVKKCKNGFFIARIGIANARIYLGYFKNAIEAARAYDKAAIANFGEFACLNFPKETYNLKT